MSAVGALGAMLRVALALVNREANDDHLSVIRVIAREGRIPRSYELPEAFQPKLYHETVAVIWRIGPWDSDTSLLLTAQIVSCIAGILTVFVVGLFLSRQAFSTRIRLVAFSLVALNPKLIGLSAQATNDSFVILFSTVALVSGWLFLRSGTRRHFLMMAASCVLAALSKGNGLVTFLTVAAVLAFAALRGPRRAGMSRIKMAVWTMAFVAGFVGLFASVGPYRANYEDSGGRLLGINIPPDPLPPLVNSTFVRRPGTTSVVSTYLTFRFVDLIRHPAIVDDPNDPSVYPLHRTSLWSQLYGRASSLHFDQWPPSWIDRRAPTLAVTRSVLVLGLLPAAILLTGLFRAGATVLRAVRTPGPVPGDVLGVALMVGVFVAFVAFIVVFTFRYRDFASMKVEYMLPGMLGAVILFCVGAARLERSRLPPVVHRGLGGAVVVLCGFYVLDVVILVARLA